MNDDTLSHEEKKQREWDKEHADGGFRCAHCGQWVVIDDFIGTANRNHCNICLWSKHVDETKGDRLAVCHGDMQPIGLTFKEEGEGRQGEIMLIHHCTKCSKLSINRIARDDREGKILEIFDKSLDMSDEMAKRLVDENIVRLIERDRQEVRTQLFGK